MDNKETIKKNIEILDYQKKILFENQKNNIGLIDSFSSKFSKYKEIKYIRKVPVYRGSKKLNMKVIKEIVLEKDTFDFRDFDIFVRNFSKIFRKKAFVIDAGFNKDELEFIWLFVHDMVKDKPNNPYCRAYLKMEIIKPQWHQIIDKQISNIRALKNSISGIRATDLEELDKAIAHLEDEKNFFDTLNLAFLEPSRRMFIKKAATMAVGGFILLNPLLSKLIRHTGAAYAETGFEIELKKEIKPADYRVYEWIKTKWGIKDLSKKEALAVANNLYGISSLFGTIEELDKMWKDIKLKEKFNISDFIVFREIMLKYSILDLKEHSKTRYKRCWDLYSNIVKDAEARRIFLRKELGLVYESDRYSSRLLDAVYLTVKDKSYKKDSPLAVFIINKSDWNMAFNNLSFDDFIPGYRIMIFEIRNENEFSNEIRQAYLLRGKISLLSLHGHGSKYSIKLGTGVSEKVELDFFEYREWVKIEKYLAKDCSVILHACSTGAGVINLAKIFCEVLNRPVYAAKKPAFGVIYLFDENNHFKKAELLDKGQSYLIAYRKINPNIRMSQIKTVTVCYLPNNEPKLIYYLRYIIKIIRLSERNVTDRKAAVRKIWKQASKNEKDAYRFYRHKVILKEVVGVIDALERYGYL